MTDTETAILEVEQLAYHYPAQKHRVLTDVNLRIPQGSFTAIVGRSGCGKTTLLNVIAGYLQPATGYCRFNGKEIIGPSPNFIPIYQVDALLPWMRVRDNVMLSSRLANNCKPTAEEIERATLLLKEVELEPHDICSMYPKLLSEGMKKRVEIARALFAQPQVILADEPFANLDLDTQESMHQLVERIWQKGNLTIVFNTHNLYEALYLASEIIVLGPSPPSTVVIRLKNRFQGQVAAHRDQPQEYYEFFDGIRRAMKGETANA